MKSAYERALERFTVESRQYTADQKRALAEIDRVYEAKIAESKLAAEPHLTAAAEDPEKGAKIRESLARDVADLERRREAEKEQVRRKAR